MGLGMFQHSDPGPFQREANLMFKQRWLKSIQTSCLTFVMSRMNRAVRCGSLGISGAPTFCGKNGQALNGMGCFETLGSGENAQAKSSH